jgi:hypothetical protein
LPAVCPALLRALLAAVLGASLACHSDTLTTNAGTDYTVQTIDQQPHNDVDLLVVVDNSEGMGPKQQALMAGFPALVQALRASPGGLPNLRVGVVSTNLGAPGSRVAECDGNDRGLLQGPAPGCAAAPAGRFLVSLDGGTRSNFAGDPADAFGCVVRALGTAGCSFEQPLAAARRALNTDQPIENEGFLRPGSFLGLLLVSDEDDCSAPPTTDLFEPSPARYGPQGSFRCNQFGHLCGGRPPAAGAAPLTDCRSAEELGKLTPVSEIAGFFRALVPPDRLLVSVIAGPPTPYVVRMTGGDAEIAPSCQSATGPAAPAVRLKQFADGFGPRGSFSSVCDGDLSGALARFGQSIVQQAGAACLTTAPVRLGSANDGGGRADCWVSESAAGLGRDLALPHCEVGGLRPCWNVVQSRDRCETSGYELRIERGETAVLPGTVDTLRCRVCTKAGDPRCP